MLDVAEPRAPDLADDARGGVDEASGLVAGGGGDRQNPTRPQHPPRRRQEQPELPAGEHRRVRPAHRAARPPLTRRGPASGLVGRWGGDDQGDITEVVGEATGHLVRPAGPHLYTVQLVLGQGGAQAGADVLGEREVRDQRDTAPTEFGGGGQRRLARSEPLSDHIALASTGRDQMPRELPPHGLTVPLADLALGHL